MVRLPSAPGIVKPVLKSVNTDSALVFEDQPELCGETLPFLTSEKRDWLQGRYVSCTWNMEEFLKKKDEVVAKDLLKVRLRLE